MMKRFLLLIIIICNAAHLMAQCAVTIPSSAIVTSTISYNFCHDSDYWICVNYDALFNKGGYNNNIYMEGLYRFTLDSQNSTLWAKDNSVVTVKGNNNTVYYSPRATIIDSSTNINLVPCSTIKYDYSVAPNPGCEISTSIVNFDKESFNMFPNPTKDYVFIESPFPVLSVTVHDINGNLLSTYKFEETLTVKLNLRTFTTGIYNINIESTGGRLNRRLVVK